MDPFSALGVAASAVQFFDFSRVLLKEYQGQRDMAKSLTQESFRKATEDLASCVQRMSRVATSSETGLESTNEEESLQELLEDCHNLAQELLVILYELAPKVQQSRWTSFCHAFKTIRKSEQIEGIREQIVYLRGQLVLRVLASLNKKLDATLDSQAQQINTLERTGQEITGIIAFNHLETREAILSLKDGGVKTFSGKRPYRSPQLDDSEISDADSMLRLQGPVGQAEPRASFGTGTEALKQESTIRRYILRCLHYRHISDRYDTVTMAHQKTFEWVFCDPKESDRSWSDFAEWLEKGSGCYWVRGKAGSGKSTLMKFIHRDEQTALLLREWAAPSSLTTASFFFWYLGYSIQKSQQGLLRSLLHEILDKNPGLMTRIMPELYIEATKNPQFDGFESPSLDELIRWFTNLGKFLSSNNSHRMCLFVDGIDEYAGDCTELLKLFTDISSMTSNLKFVLSSRPISECVDILRHHPSLRLENLTREDIRRYAVDILQDKAEDMGHESELENIIEEVVHKSCGVFLWVAVVVRSLFAGLRDGDTLDELQIRLNNMPSELSDLYRHMIDRIPHNYRTQAFQMLQVLAANFGQRHGAPDGGYFRPFPALQLSFALEDTAQSLQVPRIQPLSETEAAKRLHQIEARVRSRSLGLVEIKESIDRASCRGGFRQYHVDFIHRTVMEFLKEPEAAATLQSHTGGSNFDPYHALFASSVSMIKSTQIRDRSGLILEDEDIWAVSPWQDVPPTILLANSSEMYGAPIPASYLDEFENALSQHWRGPSTREVLEQTNPDMAGLSGPRSATHWFRLLLEESQQSHSVPFVYHHETPFRLWEVKRTLQKAFFAMRNSPMGTAVVDSILYRNLLKLDADLGFDFVTMMCPLPTYLEQQLKRSSNGIGKAELAGLLNFLVHKDAFLRFPLFESRMFSEPAARCFELLLQAGADPNEVSYMEPSEYSIWTVFLGTLLLWTEGRMSQHELEAADEDCPQVERVIKAFVLAGADLAAEFAFGSEALTPPTAIGRMLRRQQRVALSDHALEDCLRHTLEFMTDRLPDETPRSSLFEAKAASDQPSRLSSAEKENMSRSSTDRKGHTHRPKISKSLTYLFRRRITRSS